METELKTLKDFEEEGNIERNCCLDDLKQEAIKWVNKEGMIITADEWIEFFNITEKDLK